MKSIQLKPFYFTVLFLTITFNVLNVGVVYSQMSESNSALNKYGIGVSFINNYDLYRSGTLVTPLGYHLGDMKGMTGEKTGFDLSYGLDVSYDFSSRVSMDINYSLGSMRGATEDDVLYYESGISTYGVALNLGLLSRSGKRKVIPYLRGGFGNLSYSTTVRFSASDLALNRFEPSASGSASTWMLGGGFRYHINDRMNLFAQVEHNSIATDKVDGNDFGNTDNSILRSSIGFRYTFGGGKGSNGNDDSQDAGNSGAMNKTSRTPVASKKVDISPNTYLSSVSENELNNYVRLMHNNPNAVLNVTYFIPNNSNLSESRLTQKTQKSKNYILKTLAKAGVDPSRILIKFSDEIDNVSFLDNNYLTLSISN